MAFQCIYLSLGFFINEVHNDVKSEIYPEEIHDCNLYTAVVKEAPLLRNDNVRLVVGLASARQENIWHTETHNCYLYFKNDSNALELSPGDEIVFSGNLSPVPAPLNPGQFDFRYYSSLHRIYYQAYMGKNSWRRYSVSGKFNLKRISIQLRDKFLDQYKKAGIRGQEYAVLSALVLGYSDEIDRTTMQAFSASGTLHILSVSGMHVGIIFAAVAAMLKFLERKKTLRIIRLIILLSVLWFYAMLTGLSPSVIRSAMMFSFIIIGRSLNRSSNIYNSLALSAFCIFIFFDPLMLFETGLQLSFLAVAGIAFLYPIIYKWFYMENKYLDKVWALIAVSIAAQAATFPLSIYCFHQFPNYFIPANLIIIPLSTVGIFSGILLLFIAPFSSLSVYAGWLVNKVILLLNSSALFMENLPGSVWHEISIHIQDMIIIYIILFVIIYFMETKSIRFFYAIQVFTCLLLCSFILNQIQRNNKKTLLVFSNTNYLSFQLNFGENSWLFYHPEDSVKAINYSGSYCIAEGLPISKRTKICLDVRQNELADRNIFVRNNLILIDRYTIMDLTIGSGFPRISNFNKPDLLCLGKASFKINTYKNIIPKEIILNDHSIKLKSIQELNFPASKLFLLSRGARLIEL